MARMTAGALACALTFVVSTNVSAQARTIPGEHVTKSATVVALEQASRMLTVRTADGELHTSRVPESVKAFSQAKPGDKVTLTYYDNIVIIPKKPGEPDVNTLTGAVTRSGGGAGTVAAQRAITATVDAVDMNVPSISLKGPNGWAYATKVQDKKVLEGVKVGDRFDITWTEAVLVSLAPPKT